MNSLLAFLLSGSIFLSSFFSALFSIPVSPFTDKSINTSGFDDAEAAVVYYINLLNHRRQYNVSEKDMLALKCTTAQIVVDYFSPSWSESTITSIIDVFEPTSLASAYIYEFQAILNSLAIAIDQNKFSFDIPENLQLFFDHFADANAVNFNDSYSNIFGSSIKMITYYYSLHDHLTFNDNDILSDAALEAAMIKVLESLEQNKPYFIIDTLDVDSTFIQFFSNSLVYSEFLIDYAAFGEEHDYFVVLLLDTYYTRLMLNSSYLNYQGYVFIALDGDYFAVSNSTSNGVYFVNYYDVYWNQMNNNSDRVVYGKYYDGSSFIEIDNTYRAYLYNNQIYYNFKNNQSLLRNLITDYGNVGKFYRSSSFVSTPLFSTKKSGFVIFNSLEEFKNYTIDSSLFFKADNPSYVIKGDYFNDLKYTEVNQEYYNSIKNYITTNNIQYVTNTAQNEFNTIYNNYTTIINNYVSPSGPGEGGGEGDGESTGLLQEISKKLSNIHTTMLIWMGLDQIDPPSCDGPETEPEEGVSVFDFLLLLIYVAFFIVLLWKILKLAFSVLGWIVHLFNIEPYTDNLNSHFVDTFHFLRNDIQSYDLNGDPVYYFGIKEPIYILGTLSPFDFMVVIFEIAFVGVVFALVHRYVKDFNPNNLKG